MSFFTRLWDYITDLFDEHEQKIIHFFDALVASIAKNGGALLIEAANAAVAAAEKQGGSGSDKFNAAKNSVVTTLESRGIPVVIHAVNGAIEAAVAQLNKNN